MNPILVALDYMKLDDAMAMAEATKEHVGGFKVGLKLIMSEGPGVIGRIAELGLPVFADAKLHDIPDQVRDAASALASHGARWVTAHATGGEIMLRAAVKGMADGAAGREAGVLAVTVLTSLDDRDLGSIGLAGPVARRAEALAGLAAGCGVEGIVCAPTEVAAVKAASPGLIMVTPGIRADTADNHDQKRFATPEAALGAGADFLVVGRAITGASEPAVAAASMVETLRSLT